MKDIIQRYVHMNCFEDTFEKLSKEDGRESITLIYNLKDLIRAFVVQAPE